MPNPTSLWAAVPLLCAAASASAAGAQSAPAADSQAVAAVRPDSVRPYLVFAPVNESWFVAASRGKRMLLDIGRVDLEVRKDSAVAAAYRDAVAQVSPFKLGTTFVLRAPWGTEEVRATAFDSWNGRIVAVLAGSVQMDSAAQERAAVAASAYRAPSRGAASLPGAVTPPIAMTPEGAAPCVRAPIEEPFASRLKFVRDSLETEMRALGMPIYERLAKRVTASWSRVSGCFGGASRALLAVSLRANGAEWTRERVVMVDTLGRAVQVRVEDGRFRVHDLMHALDVDGDGIDDVATVGRTFRAGGTTLLRWDEKLRRLVRVAAGFVWEDL